MNTLLLKLMTYPPAVLGPFLRSNADCYFTKEWVPIWERGRGSPLLGRLLHIGLRLALALVRILAVGLLLVVPAQLSVDEVPLSMSFSTFRISRERRNGLKFITVCKRSKKTVSKDIYQHSDP